MVLEQIKLLCEKEGISLNELEEKLGYSKNTLYRLKTQNPGSDKLKKLADYFQVSTDFLLGRPMVGSYSDVGLALENILEILCVQEDVQFYGNLLSDRDKTKISTALELTLKLCEQQDK